MSDILSTQNKPPEVDQMPSSCPPCDTMIALGFLSGAIEDMPAHEKTQMQGNLKNLETGKQNAVDAIADTIIAMGSDKFNESVDRFNMLMFQATDKAKSKLIAEGKLNADGTPVD